MTTHHNIHIVSSKTDIKVSYRDKKFKKLEHLRGKLDQNMLNSLGKIIPQRESDFETFIAQFGDRIIYTKIALKPKSTHVKFKDVWYAFYRKENNNIDPKFTGADGKALNQIIGYLKDINNSDEAVALDTWNLLLNSWNQLSEFHQKQMDLKYINSKMNVIIREIIRHNGVNATGVNGSVSI